MGCFANSYRQGTEYLLFLKKSNASGELTIYWAALPPVNEQLHDAKRPMAHLGAKTGGATTKLTKSILWLSQEPSGLMCASSARQVRNG
jgi:hypothetical protein